MNRPGTSASGNHLSSARVVPFGRHEEALDVLRQAWAETDPDALSALELGWQEGGAEGAMLAVARLGARRIGSDSGNPLEVARYFAAGGATDRAFELLERAFEAPAPQLLHVQADPSFDSLRADPRFSDLTRRIGFPKP